jgi:putative polyhydroxyalkanoate system protein
MSDIELNFAHHCGQAEAKRRIMAELQETASQFKLNLDWSGDVCRVSGPAKGTLEVGEHDVKVDLSLGFAAKMFRGKIQAKLEEKFERVLQA